MKRQVAQMILYISHYGCLLSSSLLVFNAYDLFTFGFLYSYLHIILSARKQLKALKRLASSTS